MANDANSRIGTVGALRGFAALAVCWYHFTYGQNAWLKWTGHYGWLGVHVFFVISGFIIPYSLYRQSYNLRHFFRFMAKRLARLHPPYIASIAVVVLVTGTMMLIFPRSFIASAEISLHQLLYHFFYLNDLVGRPWLNVAYWTLGIELQWYLLLGVLFPLLASRNPIIQIAGTLLALIGYRLVPNEHVIFHSLPVFLIGIFVFQYRVGLSSIWRTLASIAAIFALIKTPIGMPVSIVSAATGLLIAFTAFENRWCNRLGEISYSLYLLHIPIGLTLLSLLSRLPYSGSYLAAIDAVVVVACLAVSAGFYRVVEEPSQTWSSSIRLKPSRKQASLQAELVPVAANAD